ncbi:hypothetical protein [Marinigracilibium pacificum]|uniref:Thiamine pyrophosphokinase n=1 Tax=Marinigracilibium pacificum TaxID=2729599 RepID=A0A848ISR9_9BACT|nr:hypothetical protein [Marinigracilibium pacificum]NMM46826.1 hypothetical protein [Marinigracilibium pacificum]
MSSHHVIREGQEPAVYLRNTNSIYLEALFNLLEWSPYLIVNDETYEFTKIHQLKVDAIISQKLVYQEPNVHIIDSSEDSNDIQLLEKWIKKKNCDLVEIFDTIENITLDISLDHSIGIIDSKIKYSYVRNSFEKWFPKFQKLKIRSTTKNQDFNFENIQIDGQTFNVIAEGLAKISSNSPFYIGEFLE